jgi:hypothetical protein
MPALAVTALLHERAIATAMWPTRGSASLFAAGVRASAVRTTASPVAGSQPISSASALAVVTPDAQAVLASEGAHGGQHGVGVAATPLAGRRLAVDS